MLKGFAIGLLIDIVVALAVIVGQLHHIIMLLQKVHP